TGLPPLAHGGVDPVARPAGYHLHPFQPLRLPIRAAGPLVPHPKARPRRAGDPPPHSRGPAAPDSPQRLTHPWRAGGVSPPRESLGGGPAGAGTPSPARQARCRHPCQGGHRCSNLATTPRPTSPPRPLPFHALPPPPLLRSCR